ncbi:hypothetical protein C9925_00845 [cyanobacterium G8-9]|nr:hypothetical protein C9925_00845 [cyanobacterium G8-9]
METSICLSCRNNKPIRLGGSLSAPVCQKCNDVLLQHSPLGGKLLYSDKYKSEIFVKYINPSKG